MVTGEMGYSNLLTVGVQFIGEAKEWIIFKFESLFWPDKGRMEVRSLYGSIYWKKNLGKMLEFVLSKYETHMRLPNSVWCKDLFMRIKRNVGFTYYIIAAG